MTTIASPASLLDLQVGATPVIPTDAETMSIKMRTRKVDPSGNVLNTGGTYTVTKAFGRLAVEMAWAEDVNGVLPNRIGRTVDPNRKRVSDLAYDGSNRLTQFTADGLTYFLAYPNSTTVTITLGQTVTTVTLDGAQRVTGITQT